MLQDARLLRIVCILFVGFIALPSFASGALGLFDGYRSIVVLIVCAIPFCLPFLLKNRLMLGLVAVSCGSVVLYGLATVGLKAHFQWTYPYHAVSIYLLDLCTLPLLALALLRLLKSQPWWPEF